jgi:hypothetical protein
MKLRHVELMRSYRFGPRTNGVQEYTRFTVGERGVTSMERDELGWVHIAGDAEPLIVPPHHVDFVRPAVAQLTPVTDENWRSEAGKRGAAKRWGKTDPPEGA